MEEKNQNQSDLNSSSEARVLPFVAHLIELRNRLVKVLLVVLVIFIILFPFAGELYTLLAAPIMRYLPEGSTMIATGVTAPFLTPFKFALVLSVYLGIPAILYQVWAFVAPGLYAKEQRLILPLVVSSAFLFYSGMVFAYYVVFPVLFGFFIGIAPEGVAVMPDIANYLDTVLKLFFAFGLAFEVPVAVVLLIRMGVTTAERLSTKRPYIILGAFVVAMLLTPPDVISQTLLAIPVWLLFELGLFVSRWVTPVKSIEKSTEN